MAEQRTWAGHIRLSPIIAAINELLPEGLTLPADTPGDEFEKALDKVMHAYRTRRPNHEPADPTDADVDRMARSLGAGT